VAFASIVIVAGATNAVLFVGDDMLTRGDWFAGVVAIAL
jgi:hypothetical protein